MAGKFPTVERFSICTGKYAADDKPSAIGSEIKYGPRGESYRYKKNWSLRAAITPEINGNISRGGLRHLSHGRMYLWTSLCFLEQASTVKFRLLLFCSAFIFVGSAHASVQPSKQFPVRRCGFSWDPLVQCILYHPSHIQLQLLG